MTGNDVIFNYFLSYLLTLLHSHGVSLNKELIFYVTNGQNDKNIPASICFESPRTIHKHYISLHLEDTFNIATSYDT